MDYIRELARAASEAKQAVRTDKIMVGVVSGNQININGQYLTAIWGGDFDVLDGQYADCLVDGTKCVVLSVYG